MTKSEFLKCACRHCAGHIEYPAEAGGQTVTCPHCGQATELPAAATVAAGKGRGPLVWGIIGLVLAVVVAAVVLMKNAGPGKPALTSFENVESVMSNHPPVVVKAPKETTTTNGFAVSKLKLEKTPGSSLVYVVGTVRNLSDKERFGVKAEFSLVDSNGVAAGMASDYSATIAAHETWKFKALVMESKAAKATLAGVTEDQ